MNRRTPIAAALLSFGVTLAFAATPASAADYPTRSIEIVVPFGAGGGTDALARAFADAAHKHLPQAFVVNNKPARAA